MRRQLSQLKTKLYRQPKDEIQRMLRWGPKAYFNIKHWKTEMERFAWEQLDRSRWSVIDKAFESELFFLSGKRHWYQTAICLASFERHSRIKVLPRILDDGSLTDAIAGRLIELFPNAKILSRETCDAEFSVNFPATKFPNINKWRNQQLLFRKLTDVHGGSDCYRTFFDSDMLFFDSPQEIDNYLIDPKGCLHQTDCWESYGYSRNVTEPLCGHRLPEKVNIGIFSLNGRTIDWQQVEHWLGVMEASEGPKYNVTQCTCTMLIAGGQQVRLPFDRYPVVPTSLKTNFEVPLQHYVSDAKPLYFEKAWKEAVGRLEVDA